MVGHRLRQRLPTFDSLNQPGDDFTKARIFDRVAQIGKAFEDRHAGARELVQMEAEVDQFGAWNLPAAKHSVVVDRPAGNQIEVHALEAHFQIGEVDGIDSSEDHAPFDADGLVVE